MQRINRLLVAAALLSGCGGGGDGELLAAIPNSGFAGRTADVVLVANDASWSDGTTADFGEGITVNSVEVLADGALVANISVADDASFGMRDITVDGSTLSSGFEVKSAIQVETQGTVAQGSLAIVTITNLDVANPFDVTSTGDGLFTPIEYTNFTAGAIDGMDTLVNVVEPYGAELILLTDVNATPGASTIDIMSGPSGEQVRSLGEVDVEARSATALTTGTPATGSINTAFDSALYEVSASDFSLLDFTVTTTSQDAAPAIALLPASGSFGDLIRFSDAISMPGSGSFYLVVWENSGIAPFNFSLAADATAATQQAEAEDNNTKASAQALGALPSVVTAGSLSSVDDADWYAITVTADDAGKGIHVVTMAGDPYCDTVVEIFAPNGTTSLGGPSDDFGVHEDWTSTAIGGAGTYYVKVSASVDYFDPSYKNYDALIQIVDTPATPQG